MAIEDDKSITWGDLKEETLKALFGKWVRQIIRRCFLTFMPVILLIGGGFISVTAWYLTDMRKEIKNVSLSQVRQETQITAIHATVIRLQDKVFKND